MQQAGRDGVDVHLPVGQNTGHGERMREVGLSALSHLSSVGLCAEDIGPHDDVEVGVVRVVSDRIENVIESHADSIPPSGDRVALNGMQVQVYCCNSELILVGETRDERGMASRTGQLGDEDGLELIVGALQSIIHDQVVEVATLGELEVGLAHAPLDDSLVVGTSRGEASTEGLHRWGRMNTLKCAMPLART